MFVDVCVCIYIHMITCIYIYIYIHIYMGGFTARRQQRPKCPPRRPAGLRQGGVHPVSITRFPLRRFSPGAGLLRNPFVHR